MTKETIYQKLDEFQDVLTEISLLPNIEVDDCMIDQMEYIHDELSNILFDLVKEG